MKFVFENLGAIDQATLELSPLTVVCGLNNTGKTYVTYATYSLLGAWRRLVEWNISSAHMRSLLENGVLRVDLQQSFVLKWDEIRRKTAENWKAFLPFAMAAPEQRFANTLLTFDFPLTDAWIERNYESEFTSDQGKVIFTARKPAGGTEIEIAALREPTRMNASLKTFWNKPLVGSPLPSSANSCGFQEIAGGAGRYPRGHFSP
jgi:hypothetical protein